MPAFINFQVLDVGQGSGNFIEIYDAPGGPLQAAILIDLGTEGDNSAAIVAPSVDYVVARLKQMPQPTLDTLVISHSDSDHHSAIKKVLSAFLPAGTPNVPANQTLRINSVRYGGAYKNYAKGREIRRPDGTMYKRNLLDLVQDYMIRPTDVRSFPAPSSSFLRFVPEPFRTVRGVELYMLMANVVRLEGAVNDEDVFAGTNLKKRKRGPDSYALNTVSLVVLVRYAGVSFVVTGDATGTTLAEINSVVGRMSQANRTAFLGNVFMLTLPHHGSATTTFSLSGIRVAGPPRMRGQALARWSLEQFAANMGARTITASAERNDFHHPSADVMRYFWPRLSPTVYYEDPLLALAGAPGRHFYTAYFVTTLGFTVSVPVVGRPQAPAPSAPWPAEEDWYSVQTDANVFSNVYYDSGRARALVVPPSPITPSRGVPMPPAIPPEAVSWSFAVDANGVCGVERLQTTDELLLVRRAMEAEAAPGMIPDVVLPPPLAPTERMARVARRSGPGEEGAPPVPAAVPPSRPPAGPVPPRPRGAKVVP